MIRVMLDSHDFSEIRARLTLYEVWRAGRLTWAESDTPEWAPSDDERTALAVYEFVSTLPGANVVLTGAVQARGKARKRA